MKNLTRILRTYTSESYNGPPMSTDAILFAAADEIERLGGELKTTKRDLSFYLSTDVGELSDEIRKVISDNDSLANNPAIHPIARAVHSVVASRLSRTMKQ